MHVFGQKGKIDLFKDNNSALFGISTFFIGFPRKPCPFLPLF